MIDVALLSVIRRWHHRDGKSIREIAKRTGLSRNTVRKYLTNNEVEPQYSKYKKASKLDEYVPTLTSWLHRESNRNRKQRRSVKQLFYNLIPLGYAGSYDRVFSRDHNEDGKTIYNWRHYLSVVQRKPGALRNGAPFLELPSSFQQLQKQLLKHPGGDREMVDILALVLHHDEQLIEQAVEAALESGAASKQHVLNCLNRLLDLPKPLPLKTPPALQLVEESKANTSRYDNLREQHNVK